MDAKNEKAARESGPFIGRPMPRFEDLRFVRGAGRYTDDVTLPGQVFAAFVRTPHAHANIRGIDITAAKAAPGVLAVLTGADYRAAGYGGATQVPVPTDVIDHTKPAFVDTPAKTVLDEPYYPLCHDRVRFVGEPVAMVIAQTMLQARDAAEMVDVDYEVLPAVVDVLDAIAPGAPVLWDKAPDNIAMDNSFGDKPAVEKLIADAHLVVEHEFRSQRVANVQMELRSSIGSYDAATDRYELLSGSQSAHRLKFYILSALKLKPEQLRVITPDVGGGFGPRTNMQPEQAVLLWAAKVVGKPVKWTADRSECFLTDYTGRDLVTRARLAFDRRGRIKAFAAELIGNVGGETVSYVSLNNGWRISPSVYVVPKAFFRVLAVMTNTVPTAPFRGAGRPEAMFVIERLMDMAARRLKLDPVEIRRRNMVPHETLPYRTATGLNYDSGAFAANLDHALALADWSGFPARKKEAKKRGRLAGIGVANYIEAPVGAPHERADITVMADGSVELKVGTQASGQGHETSFAQVIADQLGVHPADVRFVQGDTAKVVSGGGTHSDRSMRYAGRMIVEASADIVVQAKKVAAALLKANESDVTFDDALFSAKNSNRRLSLADIARLLDEDTALPDELRKPLKATALHTGRIPAHPTGVAVCELELDPDTGVVKITRYTSLDDVGQPINPLILHGQTHGGIAQGIGQALLEDLVYSPDDGQLLTGSFMDYGVPRAHMLPNFTVDMTEDPTHGNPLRVKGGGEGGLTPCLAAVINAVVDALAPYGIEHVEMPATPYRVWKTIAGARAG